MQYNLKTDSLLQHRIALQNRQLAISVFGKVGFCDCQVLHCQRQVHRLAIKRALENLQQRLP